jgi:nucleoid-associated protein YgaU
MRRPPAGFLHGRSHLVKSAFSAAVALLGLIVLAQGCAKKATASIPNDSAVTDITPPPAPAYQPAPAHQQQQQATAAQPVVYDSMQTQANATGAAPAMAGGGSYTVKKGDTLYSIARTRYGDGKQWQRITAANPGLEPSKLKVGQTIVIP